MQVGDTVTIGGESWPVISCYSRAQALAEGNLLDISEEARVFGFGWPVAVSRALWADLGDIPASRMWESLSGRLSDLLGRLSLLAGRTGGDRIAMAFLLSLPRFEPLPEDIEDWPLYHVMALCGPGDEGEPVITICLPGEE